MKLIPVVYFGFTGMDSRFSSAMLPWIVSEIRKRDHCEKLSLGVENGVLQAYNQDFELQFSHKINQMMRFSQADLDPSAFLYILKDDHGGLLYCYMYQAQTPQDVLHVIDAVLTPPSLNLDSPDALELISNYSKHPDFPTSKFLKRIQELKSTKLYKNTRNDDVESTYFVPIDAGFNEFRERMTDEYILKGHIIEGQTLFTRPASKNFYYETASNGDYVYILTSFSEMGENGEFNVRSNTIFGDINHEKGELVSKILLANVPVKNGVVHFIERPLGVFDVKLKPFPYLPVLSKLYSDPRLNTSYSLSQRTGFIENLKTPRSLLTFFIPTDDGWRGISEDDRNRELLERHLVLSDIRFTIEKLAGKSYNGVVTLYTLNGELDIEIIKIGDDEEYFILYKNQKIKILRADYMCTDGVVHIIEKPFLDSTGTGNGSHDNSSVKMEFWKSVQKLVFNLE